MKKLFLVLAGLLLFTNLGFSQAPQYGRFHKSLYGSAAPSGTPCLNGTLYYSSSTDRLYTCESNTWVSAASGILGNEFFNVTGPASTIKIFTFPNASATVLTTNALVSVVQGGTGLSAGTSGGVPYYSTTAAMTSSALLAQYNLLIGGGAGAAPYSLGSLGTTTTLLHGNAGGNPSFAAASLTADVSGTLPLANGGTNSTTGSITGSGALTFTAGGAAQDVTLTPSTTGAIIFSGPLTLENSMTLIESGANAWDGLTLTKSTTVGPTVGNEGVALFVENNRTAIIDDQATITAIEGAVRAQGAGRSLTLRGGHFRTYIDETYAGADAITSVGVDGSVRASGAVVAHDGTAFVGVRSYMSPGFTAGSLAFVTNSHAFWAYNEHATNAVTNVLYNSDAGGGFTYGVNMSGGTIGTADILFSNSQTLAAVANGKELDIFDDAQTTAAGGSKLNVRSSSLTNALTGEQNAIRARSENRVASMTGAINGAYIQAANYEDSAAGDMRGTYLEILLKGKDIAVARGLEVVVDSDDSETIATELAGVAINMQTGSGQTYSGIATGLRIRNAGVAGGGGKLLDSFIRLDSESNQIGATVLIDASAAKETAQAGNIVCLMSFKDSAGTARWLIYDVDAVAAVSVSAACP